MKDGPAVKVVHDPGAGKSPDEAKAAREATPGWVRPKAGKTNPKDGKKWTAKTAADDDAAEYAARQADWNAASGVTESEANREARRG